MNMKHIYQLKYPARRRRKFLIITGLAASFMTVGLLAWTAAAGFNYLKSAAPELNLIEHARSVQPVNCLEHAQSLLNTRAWLEQPIAKNIEELKLACLEGDAKTKQGGST